MFTQAGTSELQRRVDNKQLSIAAQNTTRRAFGKKESGKPAEMSRRQVGRYRRVNTSRQTEA